MPFISQFLLAVSVTLLLFLICRHIVCWYWKINESVGLLKEIRDELKKSNGEDIKKGA